MFSSMSGWPELAESQWNLLAQPRISSEGEAAGPAWRINTLPPETCTDYRGVDRPVRIPVISNEIGEAVRLSEF